MRTRYLSGLATSFLIILFATAAYAGHCNVVSDCWTGNPHVDQCHTYECNSEGNCVASPKGALTPCNADGDNKTCGICQDAGGYGFACVENQPVTCLFGARPPSEGSCLRDSDCMTGNSNLDQCHNFACQNNQCVTTAKDQGTLCNADGNTDTCGTCQDTPFGFACLEEANSCATSENVSCGKDNGTPCFQRDTGSYYCFGDLSLTAKWNESTDPSVQITQVQSAGMFPGVRPICTNNRCGGLSRACCHHPRRRGSPTLFCYGGLICSTDLLCTTESAASLSPFDQSCAWKSGETQTTYFDDGSGFNYKSKMMADCPDSREFAEEVNYVYPGGPSPNQMPDPAIIRVWYNSETREVERQEIENTN